MHMSDEGKKTDSSGCRTDQTFIGAIFVCPDGCIFTSLLAGRFWPLSHHDHLLACWPLLTPLAPWSWLSTGFFAFGEGKCLISVNALFFFGSSCSTYQLNSPHYVTRTGRRHGKCTKPHVTHTILTLSANRGFQLHTLNSTWLFESKVKRIKW